MTTKVRVTVMHGNHLVRVGQAKPAEDGTLTQFGMRDELAPGQSTEMFVHTTLALAVVEAAPLSAPRPALDVVRDIGLDFVAACRSLGTSREISLAITRVEEAVHWAQAHRPAEEKAPRPQRALPAPAAPEAPQEGE